MKVKYPELLARLPQRGTPKPRAFVLLTKYGGNTTCVEGLFSSLKAALKYVEDAGRESFDEVQLWHGPEWAVTYDLDGKVTARAR